MKKRQHRLSYHANITKISPCCHGRPYTGHFNFFHSTWSFYFIYSHLETHINSIATHASQKLGFLSTVRLYFSPSQLIAIYKSQIRPSLEYCSHVWSGAPKFSLHLLDRVQSKAIRLINNPNLTNSLQLLSHRHLVADLSIFYRYFHGHCSQEIKSIVPDPVRRVRTTRSSTHSHPFQVTLPNPPTLAHRSSFIPRTSQLSNSLPPTTLWGPVTSKIQSLLFFKMVPCIL